MVPGGIDEACKAMIFSSYISKLIEEHRLSELVVVYARQFYSFVVNRLHEFTSLTFLSYFCIPKTN